MKSVRYSPLLAALLLSSAAASAAVGASSGSSSGGALGFPAFVALPLLASLAVFVAMAVGGAWWQSVAAVTLVAGLLAVVVFLVPIVGLLAAMFLGPWLLLVALVVAYALSRDQMRSQA